MLKIVDITMVTASARKISALSVVDYAFATPYLQNKIGAVPASWHCIMLLQATKTLHVQIEQHSAIMIHASVDANARWKPGSLTTWCNKVSPPKIRPI